MVPVCAPAQVLPADYGDLRARLDGRISFETLPQRPEPGLNLNAAIRVPGAWLGETLTGQSINGALHDRVQGQPSVPLGVRPGAAGQSLSVARHRGFGSNALFPLGPLGFPAVAARGEGAVALLFDQDQAAFGLRVHSDYGDPLGTGPQPGVLTLHLFRRDGVLIQSIRHDLARGINDIGLMTNDARPAIAAVVITNSDPGGIAIDDILFQFAAMLG